MPATRRHHLAAEARRALGALLAATVAAALLLTVLPATVAVGPQPDSGGPVPPGRGSARISPAANTITADPHQLDDSGPAEIPPLAARAAAGLVEITTSTGSGQGKAGTGIVLSATGTVITNYHVISAADQNGVSDAITAEDPATNTTFTAEVIGTDRAHDVAVLQLRDAHDLPVAPLGHSRGLRLGQAIISIGNAYGAGALRATGGVISGLHRSIASTTDTEGLADSSGDEPTPRLTDLIRVDTMIVPGDSGGAVVDAHGRVIGMTVAYLHYGPDPSPAGLGWAIPIDTARAIASRISAD